MTKCKKVGYLAGFIVLILVLIGLVTPIFTGMIAQKAIQKVVSNIPNEQGISVSVKSYHRGWFKSQALIQVGIDPTSSPQAVWQYQMQNKGQLPPKVYLNIKENITHGPFIFAKDYNGKFHFYIGQALALGQLTIPNAERQLMLQKFNVQGADNQNSILITLLGNVRVTTQLPNLSVAAVDGSKQLTVSNFKVNYQISQNLEKQTGTLSFDNIKYVEQKQVLEVQNVKHHFDLQRKMSHLWAGQSKLTVGNINLTDNQKVLFNQKDVTIASDAKVDGDLLNLEVDANTGELAVDNKKLGPGTFVFQLNNFGAKAVNKLRILNEQLQDQKLGSTQYIQAFYQLAPKLFGYGAQIHLSPFELNTPYGKVSLGLNATFPNIQKDKISDNKVLFKNVESMNQLIIPQKLMNIILTQYFQYRLNSMMQLADPETKASMTPDTMQKLVDSKVQATIANWQQQNYLVTKDDNFVVNVDYKQGQLNVNGKAMN